jgi:hypothetical protein
MPRRMNFGPFGKGLPFQEYALNALNRIEKWSYDVITRFDTQAKQTLWIPANHMTPRTTNGAAAATRETNSLSYPVLGFDQTTGEGAFFSVAFPKKWNGSTVTAQAFWTATGGGSGETIEFEISGGCFANDAAINVTGLGTAVALTDTWIADNDVHVTAESAAITIANAAVDTVAWFLVYRDVANDTLTDDAALIGIKLFYTPNSENDV